MVTLIKDLQFTIGGKSFDDYDFTGMALSQELLSPNEFRFTMKKKIWVEDDRDVRFSICSELLGAKVDCSFTSHKDIGSIEISQEFFAFSGIIMKANNCRNDRGSGNVIEVVAYSPDYLLYDYAHCESFEEESLKSIVSKVLEKYTVENSITPQATSVAPYIVQYNETAYDFLVRLAKRYGEWFYYSGQKLVFGKIETSEVVMLKYPQPDLSQYHYSVELENFHFAQAVHNYGPDEDLCGQVSSFTGDDLHTLTDVAYEKSLSTYKRKTWKENDYTQEGEDPESYLKIEGWAKKAQLMICRGSSNCADLSIGSKIQIAEFDGELERTVKSEELIIYRIVHSFNLNGEYENEFAAIPANSPYPPYHSAVNPYPVAETQRAVVIDNADPGKLGRVRVQFLWQAQQDSEMTSPWIRMTQPYGGSNKGFYFIPEIGEEVMVGFEKNNPERPYVIGTLYHGQAQPGDNWYSGANDVKAIRTRNGHTIEIHDVGEGGLIRIYDNEKENYILTFSTDEKLIKLQSTGNIELYAENDIILKAGNDINMEAENNINMKAGVDMTSDAGENITETAGTDISTSAGENIKVEAGKDIDVTANENMSTYSNKNTNMNIGENMDISVSQNMDIAVSDKYTVEATDILQDANGKVQLYAGSTWEQKADSNMKIDGGGKMDIAADLIKMS